MFHDLRKLSLRSLPVLTALTALLLVSCSPVRKATRTNSRTNQQIEEYTALVNEVKTDSTATANTTDSLSLSQKISTKTELKSDEEVVTTVREYDTDKPIDSLTGTPPLKRETTQTRRKADTGRQEQTISQNIDQRRESAEQVSQQQVGNTTVLDTTLEQTDTDIQTKTAEKRGLNAIQKILCAIGVLAFLAGLAWLIWKLKRYL